MDAFAEPDDVAERLNRTLTDAEEAWVWHLLDDASAYLRSVIGQDVYPTTQTTFEAWPDSGRVDIPQSPVVTIDSVERDGTPVAFTYRPGFIEVRGDDPVDITFTWGVNEPPELLKGLTAVLVSQAIMAVETAGSLTFGGLSSLALDDFRAGFANGGAESGMVLPKQQQELVRRTFGRGGITVLETR